MSKKNSAKFQMKHMKVEVEYDSDEQGERLTIWIFDQRTGKMITQAKRIVICDNKHGLYLDVGRHYIFTGG